MKIELKKPELEGREGRIEFVSYIMKIELKKNLVKGEGGGGYDKICLINYDKWTKKTRVKRRWVYNKICLINYENCNKKAMFSGGEV